MKSKELILIVEDEAINRSILKRILQEKYEILEACDGDEAWEIIKEKKNVLSAVLTDLVMPVCDGYELLDRIKEAKIEELPLIVMTGETDAESETLALDKGAWDFVTKPYNVKILTRRLENALSRRQVTMLKRMERMAAHDPLTGLHNRRRFFEKAQEMIERHSDICFQFLRIDIDHFSVYNSAFGDEEGDKLICFIAEMGRAFAKKYEHVEIGRISADIFGMCIPYPLEAGALEADIQFVQQQLSNYRNNYLLEVSVGIYVIKDRSLGMEECYRRATKGAQSCKSKYGKHLGYYDESSGEREKQELVIMNEMQHALEDHQFVVYLQPKFDITKDKHCGAEALVRWKHPEKGLISPGIFIPVFERNGFISKLDYYVWEETCKMLRAWMDQGKHPYPVSVNISRVSLNNPQLAEVISGLVEKYQIGYDTLQLEITESAYMSNTNYMKGIVSKLSDAGFTILMDDFGSDYSSLNTLKNIKMDVLKIDMNFLRMGDEVKKGEIIIASVIKMAKWLGMQVIVEGVETREQRDFLEGAGCIYVQGYYYARPIPKEEYEADYVYGIDEGQDEANPSKDNQALYHTILIIDDDPGTCAVLREYFEEKYHVADCESAETALQYLQKHAKEVQLILVDNIMPGMSGMDFLVYCKDDKELSAIPKILITSADSEETQALAFENGVYDYIAKPLAKCAVVARVEHVMGIGNQIRIFANGEESQFGQLLKTDEVIHSSELKLLSTVLDRTGYFIQVCDPDTMEMVYANQSTRIISGKPDESYVGQKCHKYMLNLDEACAHCPMRLMRDENQRQLEVDDGNYVFSLTAQYFEWNGKRYFMEMGRDITEQKKADRKYDSQILAILQSMPEQQGMFHMNVTLDECISSSGNAKNARGLQNMQSVDMLISQIALFVPDEEGQKKFFETFCRDALLKAHEAGKRELSLETKSYYDDKSIRWSRITVHLLENPKTNHLEAVLHGTDISKEKEEEYRTEISNQKLQEVMEKYYQADKERRVDFLTGLNNRKDLFDYLQKCLTENKMHPTAMFMIDVDNFKVYNDTYGHVAGDECLQKIASALKEYGKENDIFFFRYGGEEILGILEASKELAQEIGQGILDTIRNLNIVRNDKYGDIVTVSVGYTTNNSRYEKMIDKADQAMYIAKSNGKNQVVCFEENIH